MTTSISFYSGGGAYYAPQVAPQQEEVLLEVGEIVAPIEYFENAERTYAAKQDTLSIEMMSKAVQAYVQQRPGCTNEALDLAERMPEGCLQRNEAYMAIAASSTDLQKARLVIDRLNHFQYYAIAVKDLFKEKSEGELIQMVLQKFPQLARQLSNLEILGILVTREQ